MTPPLTPARTGALDEREAGIYIGYRPPTLRKWRRAGVGPAYIQTGRNIRYLVADLDRWLDEHRVHTRETRAS